MDRGVLVGRVLQLDDGERQSVDEQHDVGSPLAPVLDDGELVDCEPVVSVRLVEVDHAHLSAANPAVRASMLHRHTGHEHPMEVAVAGLQCRAGRARQSVPGVVERVVGQVWIEAGERGPQPLRQHNLTVVGPLGARHVRGDVRAVGYGPVERRQPVEGDSFDGRFRYGRSGHGRGSVRLHASRPMRGGRRPCSALPNR